MGRSENNEPSELIPAPVILSDFENEADNTILENHGYQLLTDSDLQEPPDNQLTLNLETETTPTDTDNVETSNEIPKLDKNDDPPRDIIVDFEQVRAIMSRVTLPLSAMPPWAADIPDAELGSFLRNRITSLQQRNSPPNESQGTSSSETVFEVIWKRSRMDHEREYQQQMFEGSWLYMPAAAGGSANS